ncbi:PREDICTED: uncharacterized protein At3g17950-like [Nelumbo nucifera]|uniref:Uncharacterized protein At3g17950-like n=2 Tax=Nelumbo nucifera TaxID=4432 RepID=A0A1U7ZEM3_NELNU|nr:PREDICTED: uncharacterized protein At3g17950-like [Nelumbo nucifera]XP_010252131.1 PREDICTED: uncharacterized protein At3g17950-like [Nelumbo nucifera]DAD38677.1 TPA_asm: hypothetical protein HUJ06_012999 [Nelumbo nucifera]
MAEQDDGWPLGLQPPNVRTGLIRNRDLSGSFSLNTLLTDSPSSSTDSSSGLDTESTGSFFHERRITLGSLIGISNILELSRRSVRGRRAEVLRGKKNYRSKMIWLFSLCTKDNADDVDNMNNGPSLGHFLEVERRASSGYRRNHGSPGFYEPEEFGQQSMNASDDSSNPLFINGRVAPPRSTPWFGSDVGRRSGGGSNHENGGCGVSLLLLCMCGQPTN